MIIAYISYVWAARNVKRGLWERERAKKKSFSKKEPVDVYYQGCCGLSAALSLSFMSRGISSRAERINMNISTTINSVEVEAHILKWKNSHRMGFIVISVILSNQI